MFRAAIRSILNTQQRAIAMYRVSAWLYRKNLRGIALAVKSAGVTLNGCEISPAASIGKNVTLRHTVGIVIGDGSVIGDNVTLYQNVTLGTKDGDSPEYPTIENGVTLFAGCVLVGGVRVGSGSIVGANALVLESVPPKSLAVGIPATSRTLGA